MSRTSRLEHPSGTRFVIIYQPLVARLGLAGAAVLGLLDFLDRAQNQAGRPLATRARLIADLEGMVGRNSVDKALAQLVDIGWLKKIERREVRQNLVSWAEFALDAKRINADLGAIGSPGVPLPGVPASPNGDQVGSDSGTGSGSDSDPESGSPIKENKENETKQNKNNWPSQFHDLWNQYPRREQATRAMDAWMSLFPMGADMAEWVEITAGLERWKVSASWGNEGGKFIHLLSTWLLNRMWTEHPVKAQVPKSSERPVSREFQSKPAAGAPLFRNSRSF